MNNEDRACPIPTLVNGVTSVNPNPKTAPKYSESTGNLINKLFFFNPMPPHVLGGLRGLPSWAL